jgi:hypothetical protein
MPGLIVTGTLFLILMQPRLLALFVTFLPLFAVNAAYIISVNAELVPRCIPYIEGCTSISRAARQGDAIFLFRASMIVHAVLLMWYWRFAQCWLNKLRIEQAISRGKRSAQIMCWLGVVGAFFLILYADYLGSSGGFYRFMRRHGVLFYFTLTPLAQLIMVSQLYKLKKLAPDLDIKFGVLRYQLGILLLMLLMGLISVLLGYLYGSSFERENIIEWNYATLLTAYFAGSVLMWKNLRWKLSIEENSQSGQ